MPHTIASDVDLLHALAALIERAIPESRIYSPAGLVQQFDQAINADRVNVFLGEDTRRMVGCAVSLVAAGYRDEDGTPGGALGIIGPQRMDYPFLVPLVAATADAMSVALAKKRD